MLKKILIASAALFTALIALPALADIPAGRRPLSCSSAEPYIFLGIGVLVIALAVLFFAVRRARKRRSGTERK